MMGKSSSSCWTLHSIASWLLSPSTSAFCGPVCLSIRKEYGLLLILLGRSYLYSPNIIFMWTENIEWAISKQFNLSFLHSLSGRDNDGLLQLQCISHSRFLSLCTCTVCCLDSCQEDAGKWEIVLRCIEFTGTEAFEDHNIIIAGPAGRHETMDNNAANSCLSAPQEDGRGLRWKSYVEAVIQIFKTTPLCAQRMVDFCNPQHSLGHPQ